MVEPDDRLHTRFIDGAEPTCPVVGRRYTLTHSDRTGHLFLSIGTRYDEDALGSLQVRLERDEVLGEWVQRDASVTLELHMAAQGGLPLFGTASMRRDIFRHYRQLVLRAIARGDEEFLAAHRDVASAPVVAHFHWRGGRTETESWGSLPEPP